MALVGEPIEQYVQDQIKDRQKIHGKTTRTTSDLVYLNSRNAWIKFASGVRLSSSSPRVKQIIKNLNKFNSNLLISTGQDTAESFILYNAVSQGTGKGSNLDNHTYGVGYSTSLFSPTAYGYLSSNSTFGPTPPPGIISLDVKALNRGSIKKATIKIKAYNSIQFDIIDVLYLRLGYTMLLEWGDSHYLDGDKIKLITNTLIEDKFFQTNNGSYPKWLSAIENLRNKFKGCYDGFYGKVTNFTWEFQEDGTYDISIDLHSQGDIIESLTLSTPPSVFSIERTHYSYPPIFEGWIRLPPSSFTPPAPPFPAPLPPSIALGTKLYIKEELETLVKNYFKDIISPEGNGYSNFRVEFPKYEFLDTSGNVVDPPPPQPVKPLPTNKGSKLGYILGLINHVGGIYTVREDNILFKIDKSGSEKTYKTDFNPECIMSSNNYPLGEWFFVDEIVKVYAGELKETETTYKYALGGTEFTNIDGGSLYTMYIRFGCLLKLLEKIIPAYKNDKTPLIKFSKNNFSKEEDNHLMYTFSNHYSVNPKVCILGSDSNSSVTKTVNPHFKSLRKFKDNKDSKFGKIMNIYLNIDFLLSLLPDTPPGENNTDVNIFNFLTDICTSVNKSLGSVNNLEPVLDPDTNVLSIIDSSKVSSSTYDPIVYYGYLNNDSNFIRKFDLKTQITKEYATMITIGATAGGYSPGTESTAFSNWNRGIIDRFHTEIIPNPSTPSTGSNSKQIYLDYTQTYLLDVGGLDAANDTSDRPSMKTFGYSSPKLIGKIYIPSISTPPFPSPPEVFDINANGSYAFSSDKEIEKSQQLYSEYCKDIHSKSSLASRTPSPTIGFLPFGINLTMDGLSGIKIYNKIIVDTRLLPSNYPEALEFVVKGVDHSIKNNDWETTIRTIAVPKNPTTPDIPEFIPPTPPPTPPSTPLPPSSVDPLSPLRDFIYRYESGGNYDAYNISVKNTSKSGNKEYVRERIGGEFVIFKASRIITAANGDTTTLDFSPFSSFPDRLSECTIKQALQYFRKLTTNIFSKWGSNIYGPFAGGSWGLTADTLFSVANKWQSRQSTGKTLDNTIFDGAIQDELFSIFVEGKDDLWNYISGTNTGTKSDLENAVIRAAGTWSSLPTVKEVRVTLSSGAKQKYQDSYTNSAGVVAITADELDIEKGNGRVVWRQTEEELIKTPPNVKKKSVTNGELVKAIIQSRINYTGTTPPYTPPYYTP